MRQKCHWPLVGYVFKLQRKLSLERGLYGIRPCWNPHSSNPAFPRLCSCVNSIPENSLRYLFRYLYPTVLPKSCHQKCDLDKRREKNKYLQHNFSASAIPGSSWPQGINYGRRAEMSTLNLVSVCSSSQPLPKYLQQKRSRNSAQISYTCWKGVFNLPLLPAWATGIERATCTVQTLQRSRSESSLKAWEGVFPPMI